MIVTIIINWCVHNSLKVVIIYIPYGWLSSGKMTSETSTTKRLKNCCVQWILQKTKQV
ncbi:hypothetical protein HY636_01950 [Candidatus Woesearchaeota archaeon]|nr:hypothetical protein [Candidatus Woesearchaeota archaeon]